MHSGTLFICSFVRRGGLKESAHNVVLHFCLSDYPGTTYLSVLLVGFWRLSTKKCYLGLFWPDVNYFRMEEAPWGTFQDELDWCIQQLQTNLLIHSDPQGAEENKRVLSVLQSKTTPSMKKRQIMQMVFGDYRQKMTDEHKAQEDTDGTARQLEETSVTTQLPQESGSQINSVTLTGEGADFTFNFQIPSKSPETEDGVNPVSSTDVAVAADGRDASSENLQDFKQNTTAAKKKKPRKKKKKQEGSEGQKKPPPASQDAATSNSGQSVLSSEQQLVRELEWCIEQLELGLRTQKSTPKQMEESSRALKTLHSSKAPLVKKRQVMRSMFGDYRKKMADEKAKQLKMIQADMKSAHVTAVLTPAKKPVFHRKAECRKQVKEEKLSMQSQDSSPEPSGKPFVFTPAEEEFHFNFF
ncbi:UPF0488 protein C8orf33 homolog isoform X2 [Paramormyrops kingsleyae]|uniref:Zgc:112185 n=2 Tax=Paramormyrops kingsleyae TaxID=1676925 RepID=A0A3B3RX46_9TELE|nr:UPF0488 protein C8orf33 homolog isoform X2 [Paramormyrops kingsleyae]